MQLRLVMFRKLLSTMSYYNLFNMKCILCEVHEACHLKVFTECS